MKKMTMKIIANILVKQDLNLTKHPSPMQLADFTDKKLSKEEKDFIFEHLASCQRCRKVLKLASKIEQEDKKIKPVNNHDYKAIIKYFIPIAAAVTLFFVIPQGDKYFREGTNTKSLIIEQSIFNESLEYWEELFEKLFKGK